jgi:hypothetical protein
MAKKPPQKVKAFEFVFDGAGMKNLCATNPKQIKCIVSIETKITNNNKKVGALTIVARALPKKKGMMEDGDLEGCPVPPCF